MKTTEPEKQTQPATLPQRIHFPLGNVYVTQGAWKDLDFVAIFSALDRHQRGDWGDLNEEDADENVYALINDARLFSQYRTSEGQRFWIITEADRSATTILLPEEY